MKRYFSCRTALALLGAAALTSSCEEDLETFATVQNDSQLPTLLNNALGAATKYAPGETVTFELQFAQQTDPIREIRIQQKVEPGRDSTVVQTIPYRAAFSRLRQADTLVVNYVVPTGANKANVRVDAVVVSSNGQTKTRSFNFRLAEPNPTISVGTPTNVTAPAAGPLAPGDVVRFPITLNAGGITTATSITANGTLFKDLDSLYTFVRVGTQAEQRVSGQRLPAAVGTQTGAESRINVDVTLPAGSAGQSVVYRFMAKSRYLGTPARRLTSATAPALTPGPATPLATTRSLSLTYTGTTGGDLAALDLTTFTPVAASGAPANKDVSITSIASNAVRLQAQNSTRFVRLTTGGAAAFSGATLNSIRQRYLTTAAASQVAQLDNVVPGDVIVARLRGGNQYVILSVSSVNRTATNVTLNVDLKAL